MIALYAEMYGLPLTAYLLAAVTGQAEYAEDHFRGHAWGYLFGWGTTGAIITDVLGQLLILAGAALALVSRSGKPRRPARRRRPVAARI